MSIPSTTSSTLTTIPNSIPQISTCTTPPASPASTHSLAASATSLQPKSNTNRAPNSPRMISKVPPLALGSTASDTHTGPVTPVRKHSLFSLVAQGRLPSPRKPSIAVIPKPQSPVQSPRSEKSSQPVAKEKFTTDEHAIAALPSPQAQPIKANSTSVLSPSVPATAPIAAHSEPVLKAVYKSTKVALPTKLLQKAEFDQRSKALAKLIADDILKNRIKDGQTYKTGAIGTSFSTDNLSDTLKPLLKGTSSKYVSTAKLMQELFAEDFNANEGWKHAQNIYTNTMRSVVDLHRVDDLEALDSENQQLIKGKLKGGAEVIVRNLIGHPPTLNGASLPQNVTDFLVYADQYFHEKLMQGDTTRNMSTEQMREARIALQNNLLLNCLFKPMLESLVAPSATKTEKWFVNLVVSTLEKHIAPLTTQVLAQSFSQSPQEFREKFVLKYGAEVDQKRTEQRIANFQSNRARGHLRTRSADTPLIDPRTMREAARLKRKEESQHKLQETEKVMNEDKSISPDEIDLENFERELQDALDLIEGRSQPPQANPDAVTITTTSPLAHTLMTTTSMTTTATTATAPVSASSSVAPSPRSPNTSANTTQDL